MALSALLAGLAYVVVRRARSGHPPAGGFSSAAAIDSPRGASPVGGAPAERGTDRGARWLAAVPGPGLAAPSSDRLASPRRGLATARRLASRCSLALLQVDELERVAHPEGTEGWDVLHAVREFVKAELRPADGVGSSGDDTVFFVLVGAAPLAARTAAERIRQMLRSASFASHSLSVSIGTASFPEDGRNDEEVIRAAERALGRARERGGNRTIMASADGPAPAGWTCAPGTASSAARAADIC